MLDLKHRIVKPRILRGTPSYSFINRICGGLLLASSFIGTCVGYYFYEKERSRHDYGLETIETLIRNHREESIKVHIAMKKQALEERRAIEEESDYYVEKFGEI